MAYLLKEILAYHRRLTKPRLPVFASFKEVRQLLNLAFENFVPNKQRAAAYKKIIEHDLQRLHLEYAPITSVYPGGYALDPELDEHTISMGLQHLKWIKINPSKMVYAKEIEPYGVFVIQLLRWKYNKGHVKTGKEEHEDFEGALRGSLERHNKKMRETKDSWKDEKDIKDQDREPNYNKIKYDDQPVEILGLLELSMMWAHKGTPRHIEKDLEKAGLSRARIANKDGLVQNDAGTRVPETKDRETRPKQTLTPNKDYRP